MLTAAMGVVGLAFASDIGIGATCWLSPGCCTIANWFHSREYGGES